MLAIAAYVTDEAVFETNAARWMAMLPSTHVVTGRTSGEPSVAAGYNSVLAAFAAQPNVEAIVITRQELTVADAELVAKVRAVMADGDVAIAGLMGGVGIRTLAWWDADTSGNLNDGVDMQSQPFTSQSVDVVDNSFIVVSRWAAQNLRFDDRMGASFDGIVEDFCMQAREAGKLVITVDIQATTVDARRYTTAESWRNAYVAFDEKWGKSIVDNDDKKLASVLELGGGWNALPHWLNIDTEHAEGEFRRGVQETPWPIPDNHVRMIWASHVMEHVHAGGDRIAAINEAWRVLRPGGLFEMRMPCFPGWQAIADPTHVSFWVPQSFLYFTDEMMPSYEWGIKRWELHSTDLVDGWELRGVLRKPLA